MYPKLIHAQHFLIAALIIFVSCSKSSGTSTTNDSAASGISCTSGTPSITFSPTNGPVGTLLTVTGSGFDLSALSSATINGTVTTVVSSATCTAKLLVMPGTTSGTITATTGSGSQTSALAFTVSAASAITTQQGSKLVGTGNTGAAWQANRVALSADGNTALMAAMADDSNQGAVWVFTRNANTWGQQGVKLVGTGSIGAAQQGAVVALSADGNTAMVGGYADNSNEGAVWVFVRNGNSWAQQGSKLVGTGNVGAAYQGSSVSLSADGNTAAIGGRGDNSLQGAVWIFTRSGTTWTQQGSKLVGTGNTGAAWQGISTSLSADGNTLILGGYSDNTNQGALWVFTRSGTTWTQQGSKLVGTGNTGTARQGTAVALSSDGNTALSGGFNDNTGQGAVWVFTRSGTTWSQQGSKLVGTGNVGAANQGSSIGLSADGNVAIIGGYTDNTQQGAAWIFTRSGTTWSQQGSKIVGTGNIGAASQGVSVAVSQDGQTAISGGYRDNSNQGAAWVFVP